MTTKTELIAQCKAENPTMISVINEESIELKGADYDKACNDWAEMRLAQITLENETNAARAAAERSRNERRERSRMEVSFKQDEEQAEMVQQRNVRNELSW
jgi:hypothetical protein